MDSPRPESRVPVNISVTPVRYSVSNNWVLLRSQNGLFRVAPNTEAFAIGKTVQVPDTEFEGYPSPDQFFTSALTVAARHANEALWNAGYFGDDFGATAEGLNIREITQLVLRPLEREVAKKVTTHAAN